MIRLSERTESTPRATKDNGLPAASSDGAPLAFRATERGGEDTWSLYTMDREGGNTQRLTDLKGFHPLSLGSGQVSGPAWAWGTTWLAYSMDGQAGQSGIWLADLRGGGACASL